MSWTFALGCAHARATRRVAPTVFAKVVILQCGNKILGKLVSNYWGLLSFARVWSVVRPFLFTLPPERAHRLVFAIAKGLGALGFWRRRPPPIAPKKLWGLSFAHPIGLAAGLDKDAELLDFWAHLGFAFVEVGTVTPHPQPGNPRPRLFRIPKDRALLNRMGFNNQGAIAMAKRLEKRPADLVVGVNIGKNRNTPLEKAHEDYGTCARCSKRTLTSL